MEGRHADRLAEHRVSVGYLLITVSSQAFIIEPALYWPGERRPIHDLVLTELERDRLAERPRDAATEAFVARYRGEMMDLFEELGSAHLRIGRAYPYAAMREASTLALLRAVKSHVDPHGLMNPGALGL